MAITNYSSVQIAANFTQTQFMDAIKTQLLLCGWAAHDDYLASGERNLVFRLVHDAAKPLGTVFYRLQCSSAFALTGSLGTAWNVSTKVMTGNNSTFSLGSVVATAPVKLNTFNGFPELSGIGIEQLTTYIPVMSLFVADRIPAYSLDSWTASYAFTGNTFASLTGTAISPYSSSPFTLEVNSAALGTVNRINNRREVREGLVIGFPSSEGGMGRTSDDLGQGTCTALSRGNEMIDDSVTPSKRWHVMNPVAGGLLVRVA
jgi:hypothetical protein